MNANTISFQKPVLTAANERLLFGDLHSAVHTRLVACDDFTRQIDSVDHPRTSFIEAVRRGEPSEADV